MRKKDFFWLLAYPIYQTLGTIRHEAAHALVAWFQGAKIDRFVFLPGIRSGQFYFGYVDWTEGDVTWLMTAAPYLLDLLTFGLFFVLCGFFCIKRHWLWLNLVVLGMISPLINSAYQYFKPSLLGYGDIGWLLRHQSPGWVRAYMIVTIGLYLVGLWFIFTRSRHIRDRRADTL